MPEIKRQLAAIMFTDIVGYTAMMGKDSQKALELIRISKEIQKPLVEKHNGKWLKEMGDGAMAQFNTALDAVNCSIDIQEIARGKLDAKLRIGIHLGDITIENDDVYGDGVNVASRLESIADAGGIYISESIEKAIKGQSDVQAKYLGEVKLKNVDYGVRTYALQGVGLPVPEVKEETELSGHLTAELQRRGVLRAGIVYLGVSLILILLLREGQNWLTVPDWSTTALMTILIAGLPIALYLAWNYERSPEGFVRTSSQESWQNPYKGSQRKPLTSNFIIAVMALIIVGMYVYPEYFSSEAGTEVRIDDKSIAVMPFDNESADEENQYFVNGMMVDIRNNLSKIADLRVIPKTSTEKYRATTLSSIEIGNELTVNYLLEGTVQKLGNQVKIHAQLISTESDNHLWQDTYLRDLTDIKEIFKIQSSIAEAIANELEAVITPEEKELISSIPTKNTEAYESYLMGRYTQSDFSLNSLEASIKYFERAIDLDSLFVEAYTFMGFSYVLMGTWYGNLSVQEASELANPLFYKALEIDPENAHALTYLGTSKFFFEWDFKAADSLYQLAYKLSNVHEQDFHLALMLGDYDKVISMYERILKDDPSTMNWAMAYAYLFKGDTVKTISLMQEGLDLHPNQEAYFDHFAVIYIELGDYDRAIQLLDRGLEVSAKRHPSMLINKAIALYKKNEAEEAEKYMMEVIDRANNGESETYYRISHYYSQTGDLDEAFKWLELAYEKHEIDMIWLKRQLSLAPIRSDPRYFDLVRRVGFPE